MYPSHSVTGPVSLFMLTEPIPADDKIRCDACPVMCYIKPGAAGACDRYANHDGELVRVDPHIVLERTVEHGGRRGAVPAGGGRLGGENGSPAGAVLCPSWPRPPHIR